MATLSISEQFAMMRRFDGLYHVRGNGQSEEEGHAAVNEWVREGEPTPVQVMKKWKREVKPMTKVTIAKAQTLLGYIEQDIANNKLLIAAGVDKMREAGSLEDKAFIKTRLTAALNDQKLQLARKKFFKNFIKTLSHAHNENIAKACKYGEKAYATGELLMMMTGEAITYVPLMEGMLRHLPLVRSARIERDDMRRLRAECESLQKEGGGGGKLGVVMSFA
mgnify:FL=1